MTNDKKTSSSSSSRFVQNTTISPTVSVKPFFDLATLWKLFTLDWNFFQLLLSHTGVAGLFFEHHPPNFVKTHVFWRASNDIFMALGYLQYLKSFKKLKRPSYPFLYLILGPFYQIKFYIFQVDERVP